jgi:hypothetical protein
MHRRPHRVYLSAMGPLNGRSWDRRTIRSGVVEWSLFGCARKGHVTYAPDEPELRDRLMVATPTGAAWRCLRCGAFVSQSQHSSGPATAAPLLRRGKELRDELILRVFAVERFIRFAVFAAAAYGVWRFKYDRGPHSAGVQPRPARHPRALSGPRLQLRSLQADRADPALVHARRAHAGPGSGPGWQPGLRLARVSAMPAWCGRAAGRRP